MLYGEDRPPPFGLRSLKTLKVSFYSTLPVSSMVEEDDALPLEEFMDDAMLILHFLTDSEPNHMCIREF